MNEAVPAKQESLWQRIGEGQRRSVPPGLAVAVFNLISFALIAYCIWYALFAITNRHLNAAVFAGVLTPIVFLTFTRNQLRAKIDWLDHALALLSAAVFIYFVANDSFYRNLMQGMTPIPWYEQVVGLVAIALTVEACRRAIGLGLTGVVLVLLAYTVFGHHLPGVLGHPFVDLEYFITNQTVTTDGLFGPALEVAATYAILFITFGTFFQRTGGGEMFFDLAAAVVGRSRGGASKACVVSSGLYGSVSGSPVADVVTTGPLTIPLMKRMGVPAFKAAGIEAASSSGGAILPPVMGAVAFLMVEFTNIPYHEIAIAAVVPAALYYLGVIYAVHIESVAAGEGALDSHKAVSVLRTLRENWRHVVPILVMCVLLFRGLSVPYVAAASLLSLIVLSWTQADRLKRIGPRTLLECCGETISQVAPLTAAVMVSGVIIGCITLTGLTGKFSIMISTIGAGWLPGVLMVSAVILILLGMGMPTASVYILGAALVAPVLVDTFKVPLLEAHLFMVFFASMSAITPPVAVACFAAASIAGANAIRTGIYACKVGFVGFLVPFYFITTPGLLLRAEPLETALGIGVATVMIVSAAAVLFGRIWDYAVSAPVRVLLGGTVLVMLSPPGLWSNAGAVVALLLLGSSWSMSGKRRVRE
jgi:TRAP transporter 4TM/12TM fusion protein